MLLNFYSFSQKNELGKVTIEELKEKVYPSDTSAAAVVFFKVGKTSFEYSGDDGFSIVTEINTKIKIYKKEGYEYANHSERIYVGGDGAEKIDVSKAVTYNLVGDKIEKTKLGSDGEFNEKVNKFWDRKKITMPNVKVGSIIEYRITITSPYISNFPEWEFQQEIPVKYSEYNTYIPEYFTYNTHLKGYFTPKSDMTFKGRTINYTYTEDKIPGMNTAIPQRISTSIEFKENATKYILENIAALKDEGFVNNIGNYQSKLLHELSGTRYPQSIYVNYNTDWESVVKGIYENDDFGQELKKTGYFEKDIDAALTGITIPKEKMEAIFSFCKSKMSWNEYYGYSCNDGVKKHTRIKKEMQLK